MLCRAEAVAQVGLLDEGYWLYMEDLDWCHRFWDAGWKVFYEPRAVALHVKGGSSRGRRAPRQEIAFHRGMGRFYRRFDAPTSNPLLNAAVYLGIGAKLAVSLALIFHELATNAGKYGAFASARGLLQVSWSMSDDRLTIVWDENEGPAVGPIGPAGFGTKLLNSALRPFDGKTEISFLKTGIHCTMQCRIPKS